MDFQLGMAKQYIQYKPDIAMFGDDLGIQDRLLLSPAIIEEFLLPQYRRLFGFYQQHNVPIYFHSCGHILPLLEMFIELGVNILNPVQATANDLSEVIQVTKGRLALHGAISSGLGKET